MALHIPHDINYFGPMVSEISISVPHGGEIHNRHSQVMGVSREGLPLVSAVRCSRTARCQAVDATDGW